jgi:hypothetical protein
MTGTIPSRAGFAGQRADGTPEYLLVGVRAYRRVDGG